MKTAKFRILAIILSLSMIIPMFTLSSSAARLFDSSSKDVYFTRFNQDKYFEFTPEYDGLYNIYASTPNGVFGRIVDYFTDVDPYCEITDDYDNSLYYDDAYYVLEDYYFEDDFIEDGVVDYYFDGYLSLNAGETYYIHLSTLSNAFLGCYSVNISYYGEIAYVDFTPPEDTSFSVSHDDIYYDDEYDEYYMQDFYFYDYSELNIYFSDDPYDCITFYGSEIYYLLDGYFYNEDPLQLGQNTISVSIDSIWYYDSYKITITA